MIPTLFSSDAFSHQLSRLILAAAILLGVGLTGCADCCKTLNGSGYSDNSLGDQVRQYRKPDSDSQYDGVSTKSQQIEKDLGVQ
jgi:hypothetical protein